MGIKSNNFDVETINLDTNNNIGNESHSLPMPKSRKLFFGKQVDQSSIEDLSRDIIMINDDDRYLEKLYALHDLVYTPKPIKIYIDSYGGYVYQVFGLLSIMEKSVTPIHTIITGAAMSCGFMMLIYGHKRFGYELSTPLYHQVSGGIWGKVEDMEQNYVEAKRLQDKFEELTIRKTKITKQKLEKIRKEKIDWYMTAEEALKLGVIDEII
jgi:ATP-dependent Clp protease protease subunit